jgi:ATP-binding cassette subfamily F protein 3
MLTIDNVGLYLPQGYLFQGVNLQLTGGDKIGLVGKNGAGKSTFLKLISGVEKPTEGQIHKQKGLHIGYLSQDILIDSQDSVFEFLNKSNEEINFIRQRLEAINHELVTRTDYESESYLKLLDELSELNIRFNVIDGHLWEEQISSILSGLGFDQKDQERSINSFSGGWKMRAELARILVNKPEVLLLDEPTNHLDIVSISWLENYLMTFEGAVILISHDRLFLDNVTKRTWDITLGKIVDYAFAYTKYKAVREEEKARQEVSKKQQDKEIKHTKELIDKFRAKKNKAAFAQSLIKKLERTELIEVEEDGISKLKLRFPLSVQPGKVVLTLDNVGKRFEEKLILQHINISVGRGEKIALLGPNGVGKSTLLKRIMGRLEGDGHVEYGHNVNITYFAQDQADKLDKTKTVLETVDEVAKGDIRKDLRSILGAFLFRGEDVDKKVGVLSGGERTRLALCQLLLSPSNFLILDEPTNHLDILSKQVLKEALMHYEGTFIVVSHDREFIDGLTNRIWDIEDYGLKIHHFTLFEYLDRKQQWMSLKQQGAPVNVVNVAEHVNKEAKTEQDPSTKKLRNSLNNKLKQVEEEIDRLEGEIKSIQETLYATAYSETGEYQVLLASFNAMKEKLDEAMVSWERVSEELGAL